MGWLRAFLVLCSAAAPAVAAPPVGQSSVTLGNGQTFSGAGQGAAVPNRPLILSSSAGLAGSDPIEAERGHAWR